MKKKDTRPTRKLVIEVSPELLGRLDEARAAERAAHPGMLLSRSDVVRSLLLGALEARGAKAAPAAVAS